MKNRKAQAIDHPDASEKTAQGKTSFWQDFLTSLAFLSRLPVNSPPEVSLASASRAFGVVGLFLGALTGLAFWLASAAGFGVIVAVLVALAINVLLTGALHEDGLGDVADGFGGGWTKARKLEIMRDSNIGAYGVLALVFVVALRVATYVSVLAVEPGLFATIGFFAAIACLSRAIIPVMMYQIPLARSDGRAAQAGKPPHDNLRQGLFIAVITGAVFLMLAVGITGVIASFAGVLAAYLIIAQIARRQIGGYTGDVLGALQQVAEIFALLAILAVI